MKMFARTAGLMLLSAAAAGAQTVYNNNGSNVANFSANTANWSTPNNCSVTSAFCGSYIGANASAANYAGGGSGHTFGNSDLATLSLTGLGAHTGGTLFFTLFIIDSWDGDAYGCCGPDRFQVYINGNQAMNSSFTNPDFPATDLQSYPDPFAGFQTGTHAPGTGATENGTLGSWYWTSSTADNSVYQIAIPFLDASSVLNIDFTGLTDNQGFADESWGLQHVQVDLNGRGVTATPEPASLALMATGFVGLGAVARRRKQQNA